MTSTIDDTCRSCRTTPQEGVRTGQGSAHDDAVPGGAVSRHRHSRRHFRGAASAGDRPTPTLEVLLLTGADTRAADNPDAQYLAQRNQHGSGTTDERVRPANPASSALAAEQEGMPDGNSSEYREAVAGQRSTEILSSRGRAQRGRIPQRRAATGATGTKRRWRCRRPRRSPIATNATDDTLRLRGRRADGTYEVHAEYARTRSSRPIWMPGDARSSGSAR